MAVKALNERQLFRMKRVNLEKRIQQYYSKTQDSESVIEYGMAILVFNAITMTNYSFVCKDLIQEIFLTKEPTDKMREFCLYFYDFFDYNEWENVRDRLFKSRAEFSERTRRIRPETKYVRAASARHPEKCGARSRYIPDDTAFRAASPAKPRQRKQPDARIRCRMR